MPEQPAPAGSPRRSLIGGRIPALDGLRAISIALVLFSHLSGTRGFPIQHLFERLGDLGHFGVRVFFVISGFLITQLLVAELRRTGTVSMKKFYLRRTLRIFPAMYALLLIILVAERLGWLQLAPYDALCALTYTMNYHHARSWWLGHLWSLSVEEQFYLIWPLLLSLVGVRRGVWAVVGMIAAAPLVRIGTWYLLPASRVGIGESFGTVADALAVGCLLSLLREQLDTSARYQRYIRSPLFVLVPIAAFVANYLAPHARQNMLVGETVMNVGIGLTIDRCVRLADGRIGRMLDWSPLAYVGTLSYSLYLWQQPFLDRASTLPIHAFPLNLALAIGAALLSHYLVEKPFLRLRLRLERRSSEGRGPTT
jgi:peptidoglycan/LPS O-acetylase OafA/YrhL